MYILPFIANSGQDLSLSRNVYNNNIFAWRKNVVDIVSFSEATLIVGIVISAFMHHAARQLS